MVIKENVKIEENVIRSGTVIGGRAFNFGLIDNFLAEKSHRLPSLGRVIIEKMLK